MRTATLAFSIVVHVVGAIALFISPLFATDTLPEPRTATEFIRVTPLAPPAPPPVRRTVTTAAPRPDIPPSDIPTGVSPEPPLEPRDVDVAPPQEDGIIAFGRGSHDIFVDPPPPPPETPHAPVRPGGNIEQPRKIVNVPPVYPPLARSARVQGIVILEAVIGEDGSVRDVRILRPVNPLLDAAAADAVKQWRFTPTLLNGQPVPVVMSVTVAFTLQ